jgi:hypothetical protein
LTLAKLHPSGASRSAQHGPPSSRHFLEVDDLERIVGFLPATSKLRIPEARIGNRPAFYDSDSNLFISQSYQQDIPYLSIARAMASAPLISITIRPRRWSKSLKKNYTMKAYSSPKEPKGFMVPIRLIKKNASSPSARPGAPAIPIRKAIFNAEAVAVPYSNSNPLYVSQGITLSDSQ